MMKKLNISLLVIVLVAALALTGIIVPSQAAEAQSTLTQAPSLIVNQIAHLYDPTGQANGYFGYAVAISGDLLAVGDSMATVDGKQFQGAVYLFKRIPGAATPWIWIKTVTAPDGIADERFGQAVVLDQEILVVGTPSFNLLQGAVYVFERNRGGADAWGLVKKLTEDCEVDARYGSSVSIHGDTLVVGAPWDDQPGHPNVGAAYVYARNQGGMDNWGLVKQLVGSGMSNDDRFGYSVAVHFDRIAAGAPYERIGDYIDHGVAFVFERNQGGADNWGEVQRITPSDGFANSFFGSAVAIYQDQLIVGMPGEFSSVFTGAAYLYRRNKDGADHWGLVKKLSGTGNFGYSLALGNDSLLVSSPSFNNGDGAAYFFLRNQDGAEAWGLSETFHNPQEPSSNLWDFGRSVAMNGENLAIFAEIENIGDVPRQGGVILYERWGNAWSEEKKLLGESFFEPKFGVSISLDHDRLAVGNLGADVYSSGQVEIYERNQNGMDHWELVKTVIPPETASGFGYSVALSGDWLAVGAPFIENAGFNSVGAIYLFTRNQGGPNQWGWVRKTIPTGEGFYQFGKSMALWNNYLLVGAPASNVGVHDDQGAAFLYERNRSGSNVWGRVKTLTDPNGLTEDRFGESVAVNGDHLAVGAPSAEVGSNQDQGAAYIFRRNQGGMDNWGMVSRITAADGGEGDSFGSSVALQGQRLLVGAWNDDTGNPEV